MALKLDQDTDLEIAWDTSQEMHENSSTNASKDR
jgi:hypothetical protein